MTAEVDVKGYRGARAAHDIDVLLETKIGGQAITWIVECKQWARPIPKERVLTLQGVVSDVGADRGILVCESGFQAGAYRLAVASNTTLPSLTDLLENTQAEREALALQAITRRTAETAQRVSQLWPWATPLVAQGPFTVEDVLDVAAPSLELTHFIVPRLHIGESVEAVGELAKHLTVGDALNATASLLVEVEARLRILERRREDNVASAGRNLAQIEENASTFIDLATHVLGGRTPGESVREATPLTSGAEPSSIGATARGERDLVPRDAGGVATFAVPPQVASDIEHQPAEPHDREDSDGEEEDSRELQRGGGYGLNGAPPAAVGIGRSLGLEK